MQLLSLVAQGVQGDAWVTGAPINLTGLHGQVVDIQITATSSFFGLSDVAIDNPRIWTQP